jgi:ABC-2 type transport system ATP-binding protein
MIPAILLNSVTKLYGDVTAVHNISLKIDEGEILGLVGQNGAGKTTTLKMIVGLLKPTSGTIEVLGRDISKDSRKARKLIGYLPEDTPLYDNMNVHQYLGFFAEIYGITGLKARERIDSLLRSLNLIDDDKQISALSKGMKRKVAIARTLLHDPSLLILDEPNSGLDPLTSFFLNGYLKELSRQGKTIVLSAHNLFQIESVCNRVAIIINGELYIADTVESIREKLGKREYELIFSARDNLDYEIRDGHYIFRTDDIREISALLEKISENNWELTDLSIKQPNLEELYVKIMEDIGKTGSSGVLV